ncbi:hypothetical protein FLA105534_04824 [Flavobacterium bizetiae]|uniref:Methyltransferase domain-containing protein n=1 Tax=Flavobacterium bizetiae TaxID=2704140 RepID=A0A6J4GWE7_9FLAO|nr:class I SAM-dependent methyltransferase [Flavobacterium bizetiae]CAA9203644.1 hypothetical protein FLA105534_04824 [Flavobacterium bizetiae]CAD5344741.1 hypothetical protein FLA105535_04749 [Flavobacterium bizetiae]CAD5350974.1 hypothetical protein FLA105534_04976 [Flavobacterium bizetiae]
MNEKAIKYIHEEEVHNFRAALEIVPFIMELLEPKSVVDVGCGTGTWLKIFEKNGVNDILGIDGNYVDRKLLKINIDQFIDYDLEVFFESKKKYDLAISLEVAEHLREECSNVFVNTLSGLSDTIIFSAAIPNQGGQNHINEQEPKYWIDKFENLGFKLFDVLRPIYWNNQCVDSWYRQNLLVFTKDDTLNIRLKKLENFGGKHLVHPEISNAKYKRLEYLENQLLSINEGKKDGRFYLGLLFKMLQRKLK